MLLSINNNISIFFIRPAEEERAIKACIVACILYKLATKVTKKDKKGAWLVLLFEDGGFLIIMIDERKSRA
jgi:hypothetical protein